MSKNKQSKPQEQQAQAEVSAPQQDASEQQSQIEQEEQRAAQAEQKTQNEQAAARIAELEAEVKMAKSKSAGGDSNSAMAERISFLEGKLQKEKSQEELYHERKAKYDAGVVKKQEKRDKVAAALKAIDAEDQD